LHRRRPARSPDHARARDRGAAPAARRRHVCGRAGRGPRGAAVEVRGRAGADGAGGVTALAALPLPADVLYGRLLATAARGARARGGGGRGGGGGGVWGRGGRGGGRSVAAAPPPMTSTRRCWSAWTRPCSTSAAVRGGIWRRCARPGSAAWASTCRRSRF